MGDAVAVDETRRHQAWCPSGRSIEQAHAAAEQDRDDVEPELVQGAGVKVLAHGGRAARHTDVVVAGGDPGLLQGSVGPFRDDTDTGSRW